MLHFCSRTKGNYATVVRNTVHESGHGLSAGGHDDEGSSIYDITMYSSESEGTCECGDRYCAEQPTTCCAVSL